MKNPNIMFTRSIPQMSKARLIRSVLALGVVALIMQVSLPGAQAYDLSSLNGRYADSFSGFEPPTQPGALLPVPQPISGFGAVYEVGLYTFNGACCLPLQWRRHSQCGLESESPFHRDVYRECGRYWHHDLGAGPSPPLRDRRWRKRA